jgi:hypothetical protein
MRCAAIIYAIRANPTSIEAESVIAAMEKVMA